MILGLKTGLYYLRTKAAADAIKFTVDVDALKRLGLSTCFPTGVGAGFRSRPMNAVLDLCHLYIYIYMIYVS